ncbi:MAG: 1,4-alpha-glucan branching protein domain-containing protein, partial [Chloroflexota bacterium]
VHAARPGRPRAERATRGIGAFTFVLHTHLPYCRMAGRWPHGEEWLHEALAETYIPLLNALYDLRSDGVDYGLTLSLTPILTEQLADLDVRAHFLEYLDAEIAAAESDIPRFGEAGEAHREYLAGWYRDFYAHIKASFLQRYGGDVVAAFRQLQDEGYLEIITCAATHGYLPLLGRDSSIYGQLRAGVESYRRHFRRAPRAIWLPECAYRPAYTDATGLTRPALEEFLATLGLTCFFVETHAIEGGRPVGKAAGEVAIGPYPAIQRRYVIPPAESLAPGGTTFAAYYVVGNVGGPTEPPVAAIGRNNRTGQQVWSAEFGYPGDADYREFHKKDDQSGLQYWRVTGPRVDLSAKDYYHPDWAAARVGEHAQHYVALVESLLQSYAQAHGRYGLISANYDTELFGHWWFEGIAWIGEVLRGLAASQTVDLTTASNFVRDHAPDEVIALPESSWGAGGTHWTWDNPDTSWMWAPIHAAEERLERLAAAHPEANADEALALNQAARELLLLESSDWPFLVTTGQAREYAEERFRGHVQRFQELADLLEAGEVARAAQRARDLYELDKVFPDVDYGWFVERQGRADGRSAG